MTEISHEISHIAWTPLLPRPWLAGALLLGLVAALGSGRWRSNPAAVALRVLATATLFLILLNPEIVDEEGNVRPTIAVIVVDDSESQNANGGRAMSAKVLQALTLETERLGVETHILKSPEAETETRLFATLNDALAALPLERVGAVFLITDGQVHDSPSYGGALSESYTPAFDAPLHALITGRRNPDRRLVIESHPLFTIVGEEAEVTLRAETLPEDAASLSLTVSYDGETLARRNLKPGRAVTLRLPIRHAGDNVFLFSLEVGDEERATANNRKALTIQGLRDALRVLLLSGAPHNGERLWRDFLKADPAVDLLHFTILRDAGQVDATPQSELSLIPFPTRQLFEEKLTGFDLVIFDNYRRRGFLDRAAMENLRRFAEGGGALLVTAGPDSVGASGLGASVLGEALPARGARLREGAYLPTLTPDGATHPITQPLARIAARDKAPPWGAWLRLVEAEARAGFVLMRGDGFPLLVVARYGQGRIAQLLSEHIWLWRRGYDGGGPYRPLLRRLVHWLMREPDLEEERLTAALEDGLLRITRRSMGEAKASVTVTLPDGTKRRLALVRRGEGEAEAAMDAPLSGLYVVSDGLREAAAAIDAGPEQDDTNPTMRHLQATAARHGGRVVMAGGVLPELRLTEAAGSAASDSRLGLTRRERFETLRLTRRPLLPVGLLLAFAALLWLAAWRREARA